MDKTCENYKNCGLEYCQYGIDCPEFKRKMKPILFNTDMVKAILEGRKTQTRRVIKPQPKCYGPNLAHKHEEGLTDVFLSAEKGYLQCRRCGHYPIYSAENSVVAHHWKPPYKVGDILWVRETWCELGEYDDGVKPETVKYYYYASYEELPQGDFYYEDEETPRSFPKWRPSIHMPREAARIFLKVTDVRVERLQDITEYEAILEGIKPSHSPGFEFMQLWDEIYGDGNWHSNPWVWVVEFECPECKKITNSSVAI